MTWGAERSSAVTEPEKPSSAVRAVGFVDVAHAKESHARLGLVWTNQRTLTCHTHDVQVVRQEHQVAGLKAFVEATRCVGDDQYLGTQAAHNSHRESDVAQ